MLIDTHCHLHRHEFDVDRSEIVARAKEAGVGILVDPATDYPSNTTVVKLARDYPGVYAAVGIHPHDAGELTAETLHELSSLARTPQVVAIGEIGLDYYRDLSPRHIQQEALRNLLRLAHEVNLPVILHCRGEDSKKAGSAGSEDAAYRDLFAILRESLNLPLRGLLHCFSGDREIAHEALGLGLFLSFAGNLTFPKAEALRAVAQEIPLDKIVLETDAPFLAPQAYRGRRNEPSFLSNLLQTWSQIRGITSEEVARVTTENAQKLFNFKQPNPS